MRDFDERAERAKTELPHLFHLLGHKWVDDRLAALRQCWPPHIRQFKNTVLANNEQHLHSWLQVLRSYLRQSRDLDVNHTAMLLHADRCIGEVADKVGWSKAVSALRSQFHNGNQWVQNLYELHCLASCARVAEDMDLHVSLAPTGKNYDFRIQRAGETLAGDVKTRSDNSLFPPRAPGYGVSVQRECRATVDRHFRPPIADPETHNYRDTPEGTSIRQILWTSLSQLSDDAPAVVCLGTMNDPNPIDVANALFGDETGLRRDGCGVPYWERAPNAFFDEKAARRLSGVIWFYLRPAKWQIDGKWTMGVAEHGRLYENPNAAFPVGELGRVLAAEIAGEDSLAS